nr:substrate-binding domain-containing protein [Roseospira marina]
MRAEAARHEDPTLMMANANDDVAQQVADMRTFIEQDMDAILISPKEPAGLTPVAVQAAETGMPVFVLDRNVETDRMTHFMGGDNLAIGRAAGSYAMDLLGARGMSR